MDATPRPACRPNDSWWRIQNHDQIGNRAGGERLSALVDPGSLRLAAAILLLSPYVPLIFMGEEHGETNPFLYFVSHGDPALIEAVREGRRREFAAFVWTGDVPDPQAEDDLRGLPSRVAARWRGRSCEAPRPLPRPAAASAVRARVAGRERRGGGAVRRSRGVGLDWPGGRAVDDGSRSSTSRRRRACSPTDGMERLMLSTDDSAYGGAGVARLDGGRAHLPGRTAVLLGPEDV